MAAEQYKDMENGEGNTGIEDLEEPLIDQQSKIDRTGEDNCQYYSETNREKGSISMVLLSIAVASFGSFEFGSCVGYSAPTQSAIREDLLLSLAEYSMFGSILTIGAMIGAITSGRIADSIGRKGAMKLSAGCCIVGWLAVYFSMRALSLDIGRFLTGYGIGIFSFVVPVFIAEIAPKNLRGGFTTLNQLMIVIGSSTAFLLGTVITWRSLALTGLLPCIVIFLGLFFVPESPRWLAKEGKMKEFEAALQKLRGKDADISREADEIQANIEDLHSLPKSGMLDLFDRKYIRSIIIGVGLMYFQQVGGINGVSFYIGVGLMFFQQVGGINGVSFYVSETFAAAGMSGNVGTIAYAIIQVPVTLLGAILTDKSGRRPLLMVSASGTCLGCILTATSFFLKGQSLLLGWVPILAVSGVLVYIASFSIGMGAVPWVIMSEIFPIHVKGVAGSLVVLVNWLGAWAVSFTFNFLMSWSSSGTFFVYSAFCALTVLFVAKVVPETKGKTLEEIQADMSSL